MSLLDLVEGTRVSVLVTLLTLSQHVRVVFNLDGFVLRRFFTISGVIFCFQNHEGLS